MNDQRSDEALLLVCGSEPEVEQLAGDRLLAAARRRPRLRPAPPWGTAYRESSAIRGTLPTASVRRVALLSDGAARLVDRFGLMDWRALLDLLAADGPHELIRQTREAELAETDAEQATWRGKRHDDATAVLIAHLHCDHLRKTRQRPPVASAPHQ